MHSIRLTYIRQRWNRAAEASPQQCAEVLNQRRGGQPARHPSRSGAFQHLEHIGWGGAVVRRRAVPPLDLMSGAVVVVGEARAGRIGQPTLNGRAAYFKRADGVTYSDRAACFKRLGGASCPPAGG